MSEHEDIDLPPASGDPTVQSYLEMNWREALRAARDGMNCIRRIHPELVQHLPEIAGNQLRNALNELESATHHLHRAGAHVLGQDRYDEYMEAQTMRQIGS